MSCQRGRKRSSYKRWLYDSDQLKSKVTQWCERKKVLRLNDSDQDECVWVDTTVEFEEINSDDDPSLDVEECLEVNVWKVVPNSFQMFTLEQPQCYHGIAFVRLKMHISFIHQIHLQFWKKGSQVLVSFLQA